MEDASSETRGGVGRDLSAARERAGVARDDMARRLNLGPSQLDALEAEDYAALPPPAFVRGYIRSYARELGLDPAPYLTAFDTDDRTAHDPELVARRNGASASGGHGLLLGLLIIVLVAGGGAAAWWYQQRPYAITAEPAAVSAPQDGAGEQQASPANDVVSAEPTAFGSEQATAANAGNGRAGGAQRMADAMADALTDEGAATQRAGSEPEVGSAQPSPDAGTVTAGAATADIPPDGEPPAPEAAGTGGETTSVASVAQQDDADEAADADVPAEPPASDTAVSGPDRLVLVVDGVSWVEVYDDRGRRLAYMLYTGTEPLAVRGRAPFEVFLGNAPVVTVRVNGETVSKARFIQSNDTARFEVGGDGNASAP